MSRRKKNQPSPFAKRLSALMKEKGLTVRDAAKIASVGPSTIDDWKSGTTPADYLAVKRLAKHFGIGFELLLTGEDSNTVGGYSPSDFFEDGGELFDGYAKISIQRLIPKQKK